MCIGAVVIRVAERAGTGVQNMLTSIVRTIADVNITELVSIATECPDNAKHIRESKEDNSNGNCNKNRVL